MDFSSLLCDEFEFYHIILAASELLRRRDLNMKSWVAPHCSKSNHFTVRKDREQ